MPVLRNPNLNQSQNNNFVKMGPFRYLLQLRVTLYSGVAKTFESFKISRETKVPKLFTNFWVKQLFFLLPPLFSIENYVDFTSKMTFIKSLAKSEFPISSGHRMLTIVRCFLTHCIISHSRLCWMLSMSTILPLKWLNFSMPQFHLLWDGGNR